MTAAESALRPVLDLLEAGPSGEWRRATLSGCRTGQWERVVLEPVRVRSGASVKAVVTAGGSEVTRTIEPADWPASLAEFLAAAPRNIHLATRSGEWHARRGKRRWLVSLGRPAAGRPGEGEHTQDTLPPHDRERRRSLDLEDPAVRALFTATGLVGRSGQVRGEAAAKHRQVQHFLDLLRPLAVLQPGERRGLHILDAGCGSSHLGLALYLFATRLGFEVTLTGIDRNEVLVERVAALAGGLGYPRCRFLAADVAAVEPPDFGSVDLLVSLHLCDTATDDALAAGIRTGAKAIVLAPCCQHELIPQLGHAGLPGPAATLARHGAVRERLASLLTDEFRVLALEAAGYRVDVLDFTGPENTAKNLMIRAERRGRGLPRTRREAARDEFSRLAAYWQVTPACSRVVGAED